MVQVKNKIFTYSSKGMEIGSSNTYQMYPFYDCNDKIIRINKFIIPYSFYNITSDNNVLKTSAGNITVPSGNYDVDTLTTTIATLLQALDATFTCTYSTTSYKITIARTTNFNLTLSTSTINSIIGFSNVDKTGANTYTGDYVFDVNPSDIITFHSKNISFACENSTYDARGYYLCTIPKIVNFGELIYYEPQYPIYFQVDNSKFSMTDIIYFVNESGKVINFNGLPFKIEFEIIREPC